MSWWTVLGVAFGLAMDAFAVAVAAGLTLPQVTGRHVFRLAWHFGLFQFLMPVIGWAGGRTVSAYIQAWDHWVAFALLAGIGGKMLHEAAVGDRSRTGPDPTRGLVLVTLSVATSLDALAVGLSMAFLDVRVWAPAVVIGAVAGLLTMVGIRFGSRLGRRWRSRAEAFGGLVLIGIGLKTLISHLVE